MNKTIRNFFWIFIILAFVLAAASTQFPITFQDTTQTAGYVVLVTAILEAVLQIGAVVLFILGLKDFKTELRRAYAFILIGIVLLGLSRLQLPVFQVLNLWSSDWINYGWVESVSMLAQILIYLGLIFFVKLLGIRTKLTSWIFISPLLVLSIVLIAFLPHSLLVMRGETELAFDLFSIFGVIETLFGLFSVALLVKIRQNTSQAYSRPLVWLLLAVIFSTITAAQVVLFHFIGFEGFYVDFGILLVPGLISSAFYLKAGQSFTTISSFNPSQAIPNKSENSSISIIIYAMNLASNPQSIASISEQLREVTAFIDPKKPVITVEQEASLKKIYMTLEEYLVTKEPAQRFTKESLRERISKKLDLTHNKENFWSSLGN